MAEREHSDKPDAEEPARMPACGGSAGPNWFDRLLARWLRRFRMVQRLEAENKRLRDELTVWNRFTPPGHFMSPLCSREEIAAAFARGGFGPPFAGVELNEPAQCVLFEELAGHYSAQPFPEAPTPGWRYHLDNPSYGHFDGIVLYGMIRHLKPRRIIEVGSGFSSAAMLDLNEHVLGGRLGLTFIDPDMTRLRLLLKADDRARVTLIESMVQDVGLEPFAELEAGDILFIDSSHVSKIGSDVNHLFFNVIPELRPGVRIHIHDIAGNLEYPRDWLESGRAWNEQYLLRAFLMYNREFEIELFSSWFASVHHQWLVERMPMCARGGGGQIWLRRKDSAGAES